MAELNFDATQVAPEFGMDIIPPDWYNAMIDESEMKPTKDGTGAYLQLRFSIVDGAFVNRKVFMNLNLRNSSPVAQEIAYKQLSAIAHAVGVMQVQDSSQLHGIPMRIKVKIRKDKDGQYDDRNEISSVKSLQEQMPSMPGVPAMPAAAQPYSQPPAGWVPQAAAPAQMPAAAPVAAPVAMPAAAPVAAPVAAPAPAVPAAAPAAPKRRGRPPKNAQSAPAVPAATPAAPAPIPAPAAPAPVPQSPMPAQPAAGYQPPWGAAPQQPWNNPAGAAPMPATQGQMEMPPAAAAAQTAVPPWMQGGDDE